MRVLSLLPAATEIVGALGVAETLVGITHECDWPPEVAGAARVTSSGVPVHADSLAIDEAVRALADAGAPLFALDEPRIAALAPDVILTQRLCEVCAVSEDDVRALAGRLPGLPRIVTLGGATIAGILDDVRRVAAALDAPEAGERLVAELEGRMRRVHETLKAARAPRPRVAVIEWTDPAYAAGHWVPEMVRRAGGIDALAEPGEHSRPRTVDEVRAADPEVVLVAPCGFGLERAADEARALLDRPHWRWARERAVWAMDANALVSRPGPRVVDGIELMARVFNPGQFDPLEGHRARRIS